MIRFVRITGQVQVQQQSLTVIQIVIQNIWILLRIVESKNRKAQLLPAGSEGGEGGGVKSWVIEHKRVFKTLKVLLKKEQQYS